MNSLVSGSPLVNPTWVTERLQQPGTVVIDATLPPVGVIPAVDTRGRYLSRHLPGAVFFDIDELSDHSSSLPHMLPSPESFSDSMRRLGVGDGMTIVVYEQEGLFSSPRAWWMLRVMGAREVRILDGGLKAWVDAGLPTETGPVRRPEASFDARLDRATVMDFTQVQAMLRGGAQVLDARSAARFAGTAPEPRAGLSSGHMPGATSVPFTELAKDGQLRSAEELQRIFAEKGIDLEQPITTTCGSGVTAAVVLLALEVAGAKAVALYDGSWAEYAQRPEAVIEKG
jgi:thiosulfate/3-mercaptopyruvate sulfurtransferase